MLEHQTNIYETGIKELEAKGYLQSTEYYAALQDVERQNIAVMQKELTGLTQYFSKAVDSGEIEEYSEVWYKMRTSIDSVKESIAKANVQLLEYSNTMREIEWNHFDYLQDSISQITQEADFLIDLMSNKKLYQDNGQLTDEGLATAGLHAQNYNVYMAQADKYADEILAIDKEIANDQYNTDLIKRRNELLELQQKSILGAEDEKDAIVNMVREGIETEISALKTLVDSYKDSLDSAKDLYEYQKKIADKTADIAAMQKQLSAYENDTSEETRAKIQKIKVDLAKAEEDLAETEYEKFISDTKQLLDSLYTEYEKILNERLDDVDALLANVIDMVNANANTISGALYGNTSSISDTLERVSSEVGYTMTDSMHDIWNSNGALGDVVAMYGNDFTDKLTTINAVLSQIQANTAEMAQKSNEIFLSSNVAEMMDNSNKWFTASSDRERQELSDTNLAIGERLKSQGYDVSRDKNGVWWIGNEKLYDTYGDIDDQIENLVHKMYWNSAKWYEAKSDAEKQGLADNNAAIAKSIEYLLASQGKTLSRDKNGVWWIDDEELYKKYGLPTFATGGLAKFTGIAQLDGKPNKPELVLNPQDTDNFLKLRDVLRKMSQQELTMGVQTPNVSAYGADISPHLINMTDMESKLSDLRNPTFNQTTTVTFGDIMIEHVQDYNDFVTQLQRDPKFEKMVRAVSTEQLFGGSTLAKYKYRWDKK